MQYLLTGFTQDSGFRIFAFEGVGEGRVRTAYSVRVGLALARQYGIHIQELPLLCRAVLERRGAAGDQRAFTFSEDDMSFHVTLARTALESQKKKPRRNYAAQTPESASAAQSA